MVHGDTIQPCILDPSSLWWQYIKKNKVEELESLLCEGVRPHGLLITASCFGHGPVVELLLQHGCNVNDIDKGGYTALVHSCRKGYNGIVTMLLDHGADMHIVGKDGNSALSYTIRYGHTSTMELLFTRGLDVKTLIARGDCSLKASIFNRNCDLINRFLDLGYSTKDLVLKTCGYTTARRELQLLLDRGADVNEVDEETGMTPLMWAATKSSFNMTIILLGKGAKEDMTDLRGLTAFDMVEKRFLENYYEARMRGISLLFDDILNCEFLCMLYLTI